MSSETLIIDEHRDGDNCCVLCSRLQKRLARHAKKTVVTGADFGEQRTVSAREIAEKRPMHHPQRSSGEEEGPTEGARAIPRHIHLAGLLRTCMHA